MFNWSSALVANKQAEPKTMSPTLRADIYSAIEQVKPWLIGGLRVGEAGDGISYKPMITTIQKHFPDVEIGLGSVGQADIETSVVVGGVTNMILEMSKWDAMNGVMTMRTWVDALAEAYGRASGPNMRKERVGQGITKGINELTDVNLMTKEFASKVQIISLLKHVKEKIYGSGSEARQGEALWSSKFITSGVS